MWPPSIDRWLDRITSTDPRTNVYGAARTLLALSTLLTLAFTDTFALFRPALGIETFPMCSGGLRGFTLFCMMPTHLELAKVVAIIALIVVASGWRPRLTGVAHWWISYSFMNSAILVDGGDQVTSVLTLLLIPVTLLDQRRWHWLPPPRVEGVTYSESSQRLVCSSVIQVIRLQVALIYLHAAIAKCAVAEWTNGTALYYWFTDPVFGSPSWLDPLLTPLLAYGPFVTLLTWSVIVLEFSLFASLLADQKYLPILMIVGISFHLGIALIHGLISFSITMTAALILLLRPARQTFAVPRWLTRMKWSSLVPRSVLMRPVTTGTPASAR